MIAYIFWHWPAPGAARYEERVAAFQAALAAAPPAGFRQGFTFRHAAAPWLPGPGYLSATGNRAHHRRSEANFHQMISKPNHSDVTVDKPTLGRSHLISVKA